MNNETPVMFEWPVGSGVTHDSSLSLSDIIANWTPHLFVLRHLFKELGWRDTEIIDRLAEAKLKAQGWLSPHKTRGRVPKITKQVRKSHRSS